MKEEKWNKTKWKLIQRQLGYSNEEMEIFKQEKRNQIILNRVPELQKKMVVVEVMESKGCNSQHKVGDKFFFDAAGNLLTERCPKNICIFALYALAPILYATSEFLYAGADPNDMVFKRAGCIDVGLQCGGWGHVVMEVRVEEI